MRQGLGLGMEMMWRILGWVWTGVERTALAGAGVKAGALSGAWLLVWTGTVFKADAGARTAVWTGFKVGLARGYILGGGWN